MAPYAVIMNGYTASLKTYTARRIANVLKIPLIETNRFGRCTKEGVLNYAMRDKRYKIVTQLASFISENKLPMVIDGTFNFQRWRTALYPKLANHDVIIVRCVCNDKAIIKARISEREANKILPENEASSIFNYLKTRKDDESVYEDVLSSGETPTIIEFDT